MASELSNEMNELYPVTEWDRNTVADGKFFRTNTVGKYVLRDDFIADHIDKFYKNLNKEINARINKDINLTIGIAQESQERKDAYSKVYGEYYAELINRQVGDSNLLSLWTEHVNSLASSTSGHITHQEYTNFKNTNDTVTNNSENWDNISAFHVGDTTLTNEEITITGSDWISVTGTGDNTVKIGYKNKDTKAVGSIQGVYLEDGDFKPAEYSLESKFGDAIISYSYDQAGNNIAQSTMFINGNNASTTAETIDDSQRVFGKKYSKLVDYAVECGANNLIVRYDGINSAQNAIENILFTVDKLDKYKMYTLNIAPLAANNTGLNININLVFSGSPDKFINYSNANYMAITYGYNYNVPQFGGYYTKTERDGKLYSEGCATVTSLDTSFPAANSSMNKQVYLPLCINKNIVNSVDNEKTFNNLRFDTFLNDFGQYDDEDAVQNHMYTVQPHTIKSVYFHSIDDEDKNKLTVAAKDFTKGKISAAEGVVGNICIKGKMGYLRENMYDHAIYHRQLSFMRGDDLTVAPENLNDDAIFNNKAIKIFSNEKTSLNPTGNWKASNTTISNEFMHWVNDIKKISGGVSTIFGKELGNPTDSITNDTIYGYFNEFLNSDSTLKNKTLTIYKSYYKNQNDNYKYRLLKHIQSTSSDHSYVSAAFTNSGSGYTIYFFTQAAY